MPRQTIAPVHVSGKYPTALVALPLTAADATNFEQIALTGREILVIFNSDASDHTVTITSVADTTEGRTGDITTENVVAGTMKMIGPLAPEGWRQTDGYLYFQASDATIEYAVIQLP